MVKKLTIENSHSEASTSSLKLIKTVSSKKKKVKTFRLFGVDIQVPADSDVEEETETISEATISEDLNSATTASGDNQHVVDDHVQECMQIGDENNQTMVPESCDIASTSTQNNDIASTSAQNNDQLIQVPPMKSISELLENSNIPTSLRKRYFQRRRKFLERRRKTARKREQLDNDKLKGTKWSYDEHQAFLRGLARYNVSNWKLIAEHYVPTRDPIQVASHAQKYYERHKLSIEERIQKYSIFDESLENPEQASAPQDCPGPSKTTSTTIECNAHSMEVLVDQDVRNLTPAPSVESTKNNEDTQMVLAIDNQPPTTTTTQSNPISDAVLRESDVCNLTPKNRETVSREE